MEAHAAAFRYAVLPLSCPKCHATGPALVYEFRSMSCVMCGKMCYLAPPADDVPLPPESVAEKGQRMRTAARARLKRMTPQQIQAQMDRVRAYRRRV